MEMTRGGTDLQVAEGAAEETEGADEEVQLSKQKTALDDHTTNHDPLLFDVITETQHS